MHGGSRCAGCNEQLEECSGTSDCTSLERFSTWTPWLVTDNNHETTLQTRYRVQCSASLEPTHLVADTQREERFCPHGSDCQYSSISNRGVETYPWQNSRSIDSNKDGGSWKTWSKWSACDRDCGTGQQSRWRECAASRCVGSSTQHRSCNQHSCKGEICLSFSLMMLIFRMFIAT